MVADSCSLPMHGDAIRNRFACRDLDDPNDVSLVTCAVPKSAVETYLRERGRKRRLCFSVFFFLTGYSFFLGCGGFSLLLVVFGLAFAGFWFLLPFRFWWLLAFAGFWLLVAFGFSWFLDFDGFYPPPVFLI